MTKNNKSELAAMNEQIEQLKKECDELTVKHLHLKTIVEQLQKIHSLEIKQLENDQADAQIVSTFEKDREIAAYTKENRSFFQSIWKGKK